ncbi:uncharacterized protein LOC106465791 isoform X2 [Limulus polyphemus]|uniref:Uncharacterized protein LOC106465791 isoform X2 n=1 Tax=Limulus polyphemus TaxID=6850 RepID=A0ABM1BGE2_LIMPO|nr:uncharacterized protein LOC106465791 isoform X2 [Limulus polyphemus]
MANCFRNSKISLCQVIGGFKGSPTLVKGHQNFNVSASFSNGNTGFYKTSSCFSIFNFSGSQRNLIIGSSLNLHHNHRYIRTSTDVRDTLISFLGCAIKRGLIEHRMPFLALQARTSVSASCEFQPDVVYCHDNSIQDDHKYCRNKWVVLTNIPNKTIEERHCLAKETGFTELHLSTVPDPVWMIIKPCLALSDDIHLKDSWCSLSSKKHGFQLTSLTHFNGYLGAEPYHVFCVEMDRSSHMRGLSSAPLSDFERQAVLCANVSKTNEPPHPVGKPTEDQLQKIHLVLANTLPNFFIQSQDYTIYHQNVIFENNIQGKITRGLPAYVQQMALIRVLGHLRYAHVKLEVLKITHHFEDGTIRVRWRIKGVSGLRALFFFWNFRVWEWKEMMKNESE